ncbi:MAG: PDZ domain-containing protein [Planctomycetota bacterium]
MRSLIPSVLAALALVSCQPMPSPGEKTLDPSVKPASATNAAKTEAPSANNPHATDPHAANPHAANPHAADPHAGMTGQAPPGGSPGMGFMPDYNAGEGGLGVADVRPDGPAAKAGLQSGDVITKFAGIPITDVYSYMSALDTVKIGDEVEILVKRGDETKTLKGKVGMSTR